MAKPWAPLVYGRTYEVDYNWLVIPEDFSPEDIDWALKFVNITLQYEGKLENNPLWSLFKNEQHLVIGVSCMVAEIDPSDDSLQKFTKDKDGRPLYIFSGYVARVNHLPDCIPLYRQDISVFKQPCQYIDELWLKKDYQRRKPRKLGYNLEITPVEGTTIDPSNENINKHYPIEDRTNFFSAWKDSPKNRELIWENACKYIEINDDLTLCLGLFSYEDNFKKYQNEPEDFFSNITASDIKTDDPIIDRKQQAIKAIKDKISKNRKKLEETASENEETSQTNGSATDPPPPQEDRPNTPSTETNPNATPPESKKLKETTPENDPQNRTTPPAQDTDPESARDNQKTSVTKAIATDPPPPQEDGPNTPPTETNPNATPPESKKPEETAPEKDPQNRTTPSAQDTNPESARDNQKTSVTKAITTDPPPPQEDGPNTPPTETNPNATPPESKKPEETEQNVMKKILRLKEDNLKAILYTKKGILIKQCLYFLLGLLFSMSVWLLNQQLLIFIFGGVLFVILRSVLLK